MNNKTVIPLLLVVVVAIGAYFAYSKNKLPPVYYMTGTIVETGNNLLKVEGEVGGKTKMINFVLNEYTALNEAVLVVSAEKIKSGEPFEPERKNQSGEISDLVVGKSVVIYALEDLLSHRNATAVKINYASFDSPKVEL